MVDIRESVTECVTVSTSSMKVMQCGVSKWEVRGYRVCFGHVIIIMVIKVIIVSKTSVAAIAVIVVAGDSGA